jgi:hypothetical protein
MAPCQKGFLQNIVGIDSPKQSAVHAETDQSPQPRAVQPEKLSQNIPVTGPESVEESLLVCFDGMIDRHTARPRVAARRRPTECVRQGVVGQPEQPRCD